MEWLDHITAFAASNLNDRVREALYARGVTDSQIAEFGIGYLEAGLPDGGYPDEFLEWCKNGDKIEDVYVLPLTNTLGEVKGIQLRSVDRENKVYTDFIADKREAVLFGLAQAMPHVWATKEILIVEGGFDLFPVQRAVPNIVATLTAGVGVNFLRVLKRLVKVVWLGYDMDLAGRTASENFIRKQGSHFEKVHIVSFPKVPKLGGGGVIKDPGELWEVWGDEKLAPYLRELMNPERELFDV